MPRSRRAPGPRRAKTGRPFCQVRMTELPEEDRRFSATTIGVFQVVFGSTPTLAREALEHVLGEPVAPYDAETTRLLGTRYKRPGQNPGGKPRRAAAPSGERFTMRLTADERAALSAYGRAEAISDAEAVRRGLRRIGALPPTTK